jgi:hypothetical protein
MKQDNKCHKILATFLRLKFTFKDRFVGSKIIAIR